MTTLAEHMIVAGADNRPPMLEKTMYTSWSIHAEKLQDDCDAKATNIILQGLPLELYSLVNHHQVPKEIWDQVKLLMQGTELSYQERECKLHDEFDRFSLVKGESLYEYYLRFAQLMNDMHIIGMTMQQLARNMHTTNYDQLYTYLSQHEAHAIEVCLMHERFPDLLALIANTPHISSYQTNHQSQYNPTHYQQQSSPATQPHYPSQQHS
ncbi:hypothetical protein Tco_0624954 [Tanacetum coccineum]|uniref:Gag protein n=1 Tax=Tanacetum coccineum TaxID=301880 RepID=A0ABQ4WFF6_9ASTR